MILYWSLTYLLAEVADRLVILVEHNADLVHQPNLLSIVAVERGRAGVDVGEESQDILRRDGLGGGEGCSSG